MLSICVATAIVCACDFAFVNCFTNQIELSLESTRSISLYKRESSFNMAEYQKSNCLASTSGAYRTA